MADTTSTSKSTTKAEIPAGVNVDEASKKIDQHSTANVQAETDQAPAAQDDKKNSKRKWGESKWSKSKKEKPKKMFKPRNKEREVVHPGSFADKAMRDLFGISLPEMDEMQAKEKAGEQPSEETSKSAAAAEEEGDKKEKLPKRKVALLLQFLGTKYGGMQINEGKRSIQAEVELALFRAGLLAASNFGFPNKFSWSNSARTDKGVHSCAQVCSVKILFPTDDFDKVREMINEQLPDDIKVADMIKVPKTFCARTQRNKVRYQYMLPSFALQSRDQLKATYESVLGGTTTGRNVKDPFTSAEKNTLQDKFREYRATEENVERLTAALGAYAGTHKFHNYTSRKTFDEANASRYILSFTVQDRVVDKYGVEWIPTLVLGQSFLLHQIRKMMSMAMDVARGVSSVDIIKDSFSDGYLNVNTAPAQGLFLEMSYFENFNRRAHAGDPLDWHTDQTAPATLRWKKFKEEKVMSHIMDEEESQGNFVSYLFMQENHLKHNNYELVDEKTSRPR